jgi:hypothetical protein
VKPLDDNDRLRDGSLPHDPEEGAVPMNGGGAINGQEPPTPLGRGPVPPFPVEVMPPPLREFIAAVAGVVQVPPDVPGLLSLAAVAACVQRWHVVEVQDGYAEPLALYTAVILESGERKSACVEAITRPIAEWERAERERLAAEVEERREFRKAEEKRLERLRESAAKAKDADERRMAIAEAGELAATLARTPEPVYPRVLADDVTPEALARLMADHGERMALFSAEGGIFETMAGRYSNGAPNLDVFLKGHAGDWLRVDRRSGPPVVMDAPALTMGLAVQPDVLRSIVDKPGFRGRGLLARWLYGLPVSRVGHRCASAAPVPSHVRDAYAACLRRLLAMPAPQDGRATRQVLSSGALATYWRLAERIELRLRPGADLKHLSDWAGKAPGLAVRLAGLMHLAAGASGPVVETTMRAAVTLVEEYAVPHALAAFGEMGADPELDAARAVVEWAEARGLGAVSVREAFNGLRGQTRFARADAVQRAFAVAEQHGHVRRLPDQPREGAGRRASPRYALLPADGRGSPQNPPNAQNGRGGAHFADSAHFADGGIPSAADPWEAAAEDDGAPYTEAVTR